MAPLGITELWHLASALARELDRQEITEAKQLALQVAPFLETKVKRVKEQIEELVEAGGSDRERLTFVPWREEGITFPLKKPGTYVGSPYLWNYAVLDRAQTSAHYTSRTGTTTG